MQKRISTPRFLTREVAEAAIRSAVAAVGRGPLAELLQLKNEPLHVVLLVPGINGDVRRGPGLDFSEYQTEPVLFCELTFGDLRDTKYPIDDIARSKALQLWYDRNDNRTDCMPHLLFSGDTPYWGGEKRHGLVATCSGSHPYIDKLISSIVIDMIVAACYDAWMKSQDREQDYSFLI